jgi:hypothetical protein
VKPADPVAFGDALPLLVAVSVAAVLVPTRWVLHIDSMDALRAD